MAQGRGRPPLAYSPERCDFNDVFGSETLTINRGVRHEHITPIGPFSRPEQREFQANPTELKLTHDSKVFGFTVRTAGPPSPKLRRTGRRGKWRGERRGIEN